MAITIGGKRESDFTDPIGMLSDCHRRIERFLGALLKIANERQGAPLSDSEKAALENSLRYFREAAPKHTADEEESLFPRMRRIETAEVQATLAQIDALEHDHEQADRSHREVEQLGQEWLRSGRLDAAAVSRMKLLLQELSDLYQRHIALEDSAVFPCAQRLLSAEERSAVGVEMAGRRGVRAG